ncbi:MAG: aromatic aminobenezylarsenical efflux permease ArsG family transporter [Methanoregulaceae archaeon]|nr:aromatic aminobenezylarsenical efflux permease ArsG family transporter [Methanoregulaceae archaeon]
MDLFSFMEAMGGSELALIAAFFIGLMMAFSPCTLANNIAAVAFIAKKMGSGRYTVLVGTVYTIGRMCTYVAVASIIVLLGLNIQDMALGLQQYGALLIGPVCIIIGVLLLGILPLDRFVPKNPLQGLSGRLAEKGYLGSFLIGVIFALTFCPFSAVLYFGMLIPLALREGDALVIPAVFAIATGLPVIVFSFLLVSGMSRLGQAMKRIGSIEKWMRWGVAVLFIAIGVYYVVLALAPA